jgi:hypothetical protein
MKNAMLEKWEEAAGALPEQPARVGVPLHVLTGEAVDVARFLETHYPTRVDARGRVTRPGLDQAVSGGQFRKELGQEILELQEATQAAQTQYLLTVSAPESPAQRAEFVLGEIVAGLEFLFDDGIDDVDDVRLERLASAHDNPTSHDALAAALSDYAGLAEMHRARLTSLGAFDAALIDEAVSLAGELRDRSAHKVAGAPLDEQQRALELRNRLASMLYERMQLVRAAARYVFRHDPATVRRVTSAYTRQRVARYRKSQAEAAAATAPDGDAASTEA